MNGSTIILFYLSAERFNAELIQESVKLNEVVLTSLECWYLAYYGNTRSLEVWRSGGRRERSGGLEARCRHEDVEA